MSIPTAVYRLYDADDLLLYVGASSYPAARLKEHAAGKPWWCRVARQTINWHPDKRHALVAEAAAIKAEWPEFNIMHAITSDPQPRKRLGDWGDRRMLLMAEGEGLVRLAHRLEVPIEETVQLTGLSRTTIYKILGIEAETE